MGSTTCATDGASAHPETKAFADLTVLHGCATIQLTRGRNTLIDSGDYRRFAGRKWQAHPSDMSYSAYYALRTFRGKGGKRQRTRMHRAVLEAHVGPCPPGMECRHINGDSLDNRSENLAWGTKSENARDGMRRGTWKNAFRPGEPCLHNRGEQNGSARLKPSDIPEIRRRAAVGETQTSIARRFGVSHVAIYKILKGKSWGLGPPPPQPQGPVHA
jgi:hypothetical protein